MAARRVDRLCRSALELPVQERERFLLRSCSGDPALLAEVSLRMLARAGDATVVRPGPAVGRQLGERFRIEARLGSGGMGEVWLAFDLKLRVEVALKSLLAHEQDPERIEMLRREVRAARNVTSPHVCRVYDLLEFDGEEYVSMEYVDGQTLQELIELEAPLELAEARRIAQQLLVGLQAIHDAGLIHRDLKPSNVMITRTGRTVIMDFGLAKGMADTQSHAFAGTPVYMAPEQRSGDPLGPWTDLFAVGVILAEMVAPAAMEPGALRFDLWEGLRHEPPRVPAGPWEPVIRRAVASRPRERFSSAAELARALGDSEVRIGIVDGVTPYPGLSVFTEADSPFFFGRELDVEALWRKLQRLSLCALIGPSGVGKSSFLRAGVIATRPQTWRVVLCTPGDAPFLALGRALVPEFENRTQAVQDLFRLHDVGRSVQLLGAWRKGSGAALVVVDQFEELFTLNPPEVQERFAELLGRLTVEADVHVLVSMRDDFFFHCHRHEALRPLFSAATPLAPLSREALRRALVQPALRCGYRFEDDGLVEEMLEEIEGERGGLPLLAFASARLWEHRDCEHALLTREGYERIGGVAGALAQHAEATLERIGAEREPLVRELFRNLVTAQQTRLVREREELLSVFENPEAAGEVLAALIDARLLTSFEIAEARDAAKRHRIEIVHESLLKNWPRLVRWQTQDLEGAQLRDQLRQAAHLWKERNESADLLWTGMAYREFELWRERHAGGLTATEDGFARAMRARNARDRKRRRLAAAGAFAFLLVAISVIATSWQQEKHARLRAEASQLVALGRGVLDESPTAALAHAIASLERFDDETNRQFALEVLERGPTAFVRPFGPGVTQAIQINFSPDGSRLGIGGNRGVQVLWNDPDSLVVVEDDLTWWSRDPAFTPDGAHLVWHDTRTRGLMHVWSLAEGREIRTLELEGFTSPIMARDTLLLFTRARDSVDPARIRLLLRSWTPDMDEPELLGTWSADHVDWFCPDPTGVGGAYTIGRNVYRYESIDELVGLRGRFVGAHESAALYPWFDPTGATFATADSLGEIRIWSTDRDVLQPMRTLHCTPPVHLVRFGGAGSSLAAVSGPNRELVHWDLRGPAGAEPNVFRFDYQNRFHNQIAFDPSGRWLVESDMDALVFWPVDRQEKWMLAGWPLFTHDSRSVIGTQFGQGRFDVWDLDGGEVRSYAHDAQDLAVDPLGRFLVLALGEKGGIRLLSLSDGSAAPLPDGDQGAFGPIAISSDGTLCASHRSSDPDPSLLLWRIGGRTPELLWSMNTPILSALAFSDEGRLFSGGFDDGEIREWSIEAGSSELVAKVALPHIRQISAVTEPLRLLVAAAASNMLDPRSTTALLTVDVDERSVRPRTDRGLAVTSLAVDEAGRLLVTGDLQGVVRVGPLEGGACHLFFAGWPIAWSAVTPDGRWVAAGGKSLSSSDMSSPMCLWRVPEEDDPRIALDHEAFLRMLRSRTNLRVIHDERATGGYRVEIGTFPGWTAQHAVMARTTRR